MGGQELQQVKTDVRKCNILTISFILLFSELKSNLLFALTLRISSLEKKINRFKFWFTKRLKKGFCNSIHFCYTSGALVIPTKELLIHSSILQQSSLQSPGSTAQTIQTSKGQWEGRNPRTKTLIIFIPYQPKRI